jgi:hypothetical protein
LSFLLAERAHTQFTLAFGVFSTLISFLLAKESHRPTPGLLRMAGSFGEAFP